MQESSKGDTESISARPCDLLFASVKRKVSAVDSQDINMLNGKLDMRMTAGIGMEMEDIG